MTHYYHQFLYTMQLNSLQRPFHSSLPPTLSSVAEFPRLSLHSINDIAILRNFQF